MSYPIRDYRTSDETSWLRCRVLAFLDTAYYDDVWTAKPSEPVNAIDRPRLHLKPIRLFMHARMKDEAQLRQRFRRVHTCRRFVQAL